MQQKDPSKLGHSFPEALAWIHAHQVGMSASLKGKRHEIFTP